MLEFFDFARCLCLRVVGWDDFYHPHLRTGCDAPYSGGILPARKRFT